MFDTVGSVDNIATNAIGNLVGVTVGKYVIHNCTVCEGFGGIAKEWTYVAICVISRIASQELRKRVSGVEYDLRDEFTWSLICHSITKVWAEIP